jgi:hypothetical protein
MYQIIGEEIAVIGLYKSGQFRPKKFHWRQKTFLISEITAVHDFRDGTVQKRRFSVMSEQTLYLLEFNRQREAWSVEQIWVEG